jgi:hypothetical protein
MGYEMPLTEFAVLYAEHLLALYTNFAEVGVSSSS